MALYELDGVAPTVAESAWIADSAQVMGNVHLHEDSSVWFGAVLRGDTETITVGQGSNVQDGCVLHVGIGETCRLGVNSHVGHGAIVHGATLEPDTMIGMNAVVMDGATIGATAIVAACAFVKAGYAVPAGVLLAGVPGRVVRRLSDAEIAAKANGTRVYQQLAVDCLKTLTRIDEA